ncbi:heavy metal-binding domain-containing protein [Caloranaerobacter azorensis]|uniref:YbjQ family protein n=1 Tax=Caloranaerobacter azorensis TaxID=116090 RepID=A0A6P1YBN3_9FIRM|nr:heavy metal-binding domain-containing protein [Caloranaerobacter azorensis]QIB26467.1 YbjQ family protein [Caloranaerobacter azorensis]
MLICGECYKIKKKYHEVSEEELREKILNIREKMKKRFDEFIVVTVPKIEGKRIVKYYNMIVSELVIGTGIFSELGASVIDLIGTTGAYSDKLKEIKNKVMDDLIHKVVKLGANAIVGADAEYMKIGGNMILFSISGTPVLIEDDN